MLPISFTNANLFQRILMLKDTKFISKQIEPYLCRGIQQMPVEDQLMMVAPASLAAVGVDESSRTMRSSCKPHQASPHSE